MDSLFIAENKLEVKVNKFDNDELDRKTIHIAENPTPNIFKFATRTVSEDTEKVLQMMDHFTSLTISLKRQASFIEPNEFLPEGEPSSPMNENIIHHKSAMCMKDEHTQEMLAYYGLESETMLETIVSIKSTVSSPAPTEKVL